jgi:glycerophosphoryl diester phosphodiesterase
VKKVCLLLGTCIVLAVLTPVPAHAAKQAPCAAIVHRAGDAQPRTENSLDRLHSSRAEGFQCVEFDVQTSASNTLAVIHDSTADRTTNCSGYIKRMTTAKLRRCQLNNSAYRGVPFVATFIRYMKPRGMTPVLHLKAMTSKSWARLDNLLTSNRMVARTVILTTSKLAPTAKRLMPAAYIIVTGSYPYNAVSPSLAAKYDAAASDWRRTTPKQVKAVHNVGRRYLGILLWNAVGWNRARILGLDMVLTNDMKGHRAWEATVQ